jgi:hypothetical protein
MKGSTVLVGVSTLLVLTSAASAQWSDNFDSYANGTLLDNVGGWTGWDDIGVDAATVTDEQSRSSPHSAMVGNGYSDAVHPFTGYTSGAWVFTAHVYVPSGLDGITYFLLQNQYNHGGPYDWAVEIDMDPATGMAKEVFRDPNGTMTQPIAYDQWVEIRVEFDLDNNTGDVYYNGSLIGSGTWDAYSGSGILELGAVDLYAPHNARVFYDDITLEAAGGDCYADFNEDGTVDTRDVLAFLNSWNGGDLASDCDGNGTIDTRDVLCFLNLWNAGC